MQDFYKKTKGSYILEGTRPINLIKPINMEGTPPLRGEPYPTL